MNNKAHGFIFKLSYHQPTSTQNCKFQNDPKKINILVHQLDKIKGTEMVEERKMGWEERFNENKLKGVLFILLDQKAS